MAAPPRTLSGVDERLRDSVGRDYGPGHIAWREFERKAPWPQTVSASPARAADRLSRTAV